MDLRGNIVLKTKWRVSDTGRKASKMENSVSDKHSNASETYMSTSKRGRRASYTGMWSHMRRRYTKEHGGMVDSLRNKASNASRCVSSGIENGVNGNDGLRDRDKRQNSSSRSRTHRGRSQMHIGGHQRQ